MLASPPRTEITDLISRLADRDGMIRQDARHALVAAGEPAVTPLIDLLEASPSAQARWEAVKALGAIGNPRSAPALVSALTDSDSDVAWVAAEALRHFRKAAWPALLRALVDGRPGLGPLYEGAHHVFAHQKEEGYNDLLPVLVRNLEEGELDESVIVTAHKMLERLNAES